MSNALLKLWLVHSDAPVPFRSLPSTRRRKEKHKEKGEEGTYVVIMNRKPTQTSTAYPKATIYVSYLLISAHRLQNVLFLSPGAASKYAPLVSPKEGVKWSLPVAYWHRGKWSRTHIILVIAPTFSILSRIRVKRLGIYVSVSPYGAVSPSFTLPMWQR